MKRAGTIICAAALGAGGSLPMAAVAEPADHPAPDLAACAATIVRQEDDPPSGEPAAVPPPFADILRTGPDAMAIASQTGKTLCVSMVWTVLVTDMAWLQPGRLFGFAHYGHENSGYLVIDRAADGEAIETGERPLMSPDGTRFASLQLSDSGWGGLEGFGVWEIRPGTTIPVKSQSTGADGITPDVFANSFGDWKLAGWRGNDCVDIRYIPFDPNAADPPSGDARSYFADAEHDWDIREGTCS